jgi:hypothetical protein
MATVDAVAAWMNKTYPTRNHDQQCQRLVWNVIYYLMGYTRDSQMVTYPTARAARLASKIESTNASKAPAGAIHYWQNPAAEGHVGVSLGGESVLMTGTSAALGAGGQLLGNNYGITTVSAYTRAKGNPYLGWSRRNGSNASIVGKIAGRASSNAAASSSSKSATKAQWKTIQTWLKKLGRYSGPADGVPGINTWKGVQRTVRDRAGYTGPIDGKPGVNTYKAMQRYAKAGGGYTGPVDGVLGANSWRGFVARLSS